ncbi:hypothetical protein HDV06_006634 [Boothiomyces sp. JEL0866]|nr:hypothetical protein HDV06_006634 [Boothiomyces sp. JEL0866]
MQVENRKHLFGGKTTSRDDELNILFYLITIGLTITWIGAVIWLASSFKSPYSVALETMGNALGYGESLFLTGVYKYIRAVNKKSNAARFYYDGSPITYLSLQSPIDLLAIIITVIYLILTVITIIQIIRGWLEMKKSKTFHSIFISRAVNRQVNRRKELLGGKPSTTNDELKKLYYLAISGLCLTWVGAVLWLTSAFKGPNAAALETIGNSMGYGLGIFLTATYKYMRSVNQQQKSSKVKNSTTKNVEGGKSNTGYEVSNDKLAE